MSRSYRTGCLDGPASEKYRLECEAVSLYAAPMQSPQAESRRRYGTLAWSVLAFNVLVVLGGAIVRATDSGDGCGASWPNCTGRIFPTNPTLQTVIEFSHRITSLLAIIGVLVLFVYAVRLYDKGDRVRRAAGISLILLLVESLLGASLVIFGWVAQDASIGRMIMVPIHLTNTSFLLAALTLTAWWSSGNPGPAPETDRKTVWSLSAGALGLLVVGALGAINALGDSLYPVTSFLSGVEQELSGDAPWLIKVRVVHPIVAIAVGFGVAYFVMRVAATAGTRTKRIGVVVGILIGVQFLVGIVNVLLAVPLETQVAHLAVADAIWIAYVMFSASRLGEMASSERPPEIAA